MVAVVTIRDQLFAVRVLCEQSQSVAEVPTSRALADVATDCRHVADLRTGGFHESLCQGGVALSYISIVGQIAEFGQRTDP